MKFEKSIISFSILLLLFLGDRLSAQTNVKEVDASYRPQIHFSPKAHWINDPNGMVYHQGIYHLFFQYHPNSSVWGPMHWGHATSKDLIHWQEGPIALYPDSIGMIFSGSAVVDTDNRAGFGKKGQTPLVAIFTQHDANGEKAATNHFQNQSIAYSLDDGKTWTKYAHNPVVKNPGLKDFRDPKVMWYEPQKKWVMTLAAGNMVHFYSSPNLRDWKKESEFGAQLGAHGGGWECPDLFSMDDHGKKIWVLIVNLNPGAPNGGSGTQYFIGDFNGSTFSTTQKDTHWIDYGPDDYAGITWSNTGDRKIFLGWMSNWQYARQVPTDTWRGAMTLPRTLTLKHLGQDIFIASQPIAALSALRQQPLVLNNITLSKTFDLASKAVTCQLPCRLDLVLDHSNNFSVTIGNKLGESIIVGFDQQSNRYYIDRVHSGKVDFEKGFAARHYAPRISHSATLSLSLLVDVSSVELFADEGLTTMTEIFFPNQPYDQLQIKSDSHAVIRHLEYSRLSSSLQTDQP